MKASREADSCRRRSLRAMVLLSTSPSDWSRSLDSFRSSAIELACSFGRRSLRTVGLGEELDGALTEPELTSTRVDCSACLEEIRLRAKSDALPTLSGR